MSKQTISKMLRYGIWLAHGERCWFCRDPLAFSETHIDHIIPECMHGSTDLASYLQDMGLPENFSILSTDNLAPAHARCNQFKGKDQFEPTPLIQKILKENVSSKTARADEFVRISSSQKKIEKSIAIVLTAIEEGKLDKYTKEGIQTSLDELAKLSQHLRSTDVKNRPMLLMPHLEIVSQTESIMLIKGPTGLVGARPKGTNLDPSWDCSTCGTTGWNGARCVVCGQLSDD